MSATNSNNGAELGEGTPLVVVPAGGPGAGARAAYDSKDVNASKHYHDIKSASEEGHQAEGGYLKPIIFGGLDGILTSFAIVAGSAGGNLPPQVVLILGFSNIFADALSMGVGTWQEKSEACDRFPAGPSFVLASGNIT